MTRPSARRATPASTAPSGPLKGARQLRAFGDWYCQPHQDRLWRYLKGGGKRACWVVHRRGGKDEVALRWTFEACQRRPGTYWHMLPQAEQARKAIWDAVNPHTGRKRIDEAFPLEARKRTNHNQMLIEFHNGSVWQVVGSDNYNALVGSPPVGVVFSEWSLADPAAWAYISPILRENGGWALFLYTPRGRNHGLSTLNVARGNPETWFYEVLDATQTDVFSPEELAEELREKIAEYGPDLGQAFFDQEYMVSFDAANLGAIYAGWIRKLEKAGRIGKFEPAPGFKIHTAWDLGFGDSTAIWWWQLLPGPEIRLVDFYSNSGQGPQHYAEVVLGQRIEEVDGKVHLGEELGRHAHRIAWRKSPVLGYGKHYAPHDAAYRTLAASGRSFGDQMHAYGVSLEVLGQVNQRDQIQGARKTLEYASINRDRCERGIDALESYHYEWDEQARCLKPEPKHDWSSHPADALEIVAQAWVAPAPPKEDKPPRFLHEATADEIFWPTTRGPSKPLERL
jgi:phage terminase large subunit